MSQPPPPHGSEPDPNQGPGQDGPPQRPHQGGPGGGTQPGPGPGFGPPPGQPGQDGQPGSGRYGPPPGQYGHYPPPNQYGQYGPGGYGGPPPGGSKGGSVGIVIAIIVVLLLIAGGIGVFALTQGGDDDPAASGDPTISASESTSDVPTVSEPTGITPAVPGDTALTATAGGNTGTPDTSLTEPPAFTGEFPSDQQYIDLAASFVNASKEGDCPGATALLQKAYAKSISEDYYCAGDAKDRLQNIAFENPVFTSFQTAGASVAFQSTDGGTATIFMSFSGDKYAFVDSVYI